MIKQDPELIIEQAVSVFTNINDKINSLISCSAKDFDTLNQSFKEYHNSINFIIDKADLLFNSMTDLPDKKINQFLRLLETVQARLKKTYPFLMDTDRYILNLANDLSDIYLQYNITKQNLSTLKLLTTNIQLEPYYRREYKDLIADINDITNRCLDFSNEYFQLEHHFRAATDSVDQLKNQEFQAFLRSIERMHKSYSKLVAKKDICPDFHKKLKDLLSKKSLSSSEIITNLQYQDIVSQKIEHVRHAHKTLLSQLNEFYDKNRSSSKDKSEMILEIILQIRNIGSLQAAQLIHANSEYQKAVKIIIEKIGDLDNILDESLHLINLFLSSGTSIDEYLDIGIENELIEFKKSVVTFEGLSSNLYYLYRTLADSKSTYFFSEKSFFDIVESLSQKIESMRQSVARNELDNESVDTISQIIRSFNELQSNTKQLSLLIKKFRKLCVDAFLPVLDEFFKLLEYENRTNLTEGIDNIVPGIYKDLIKEKAQINEKEIYARRYKITQVDYYKIFEKEVEVIIATLDKLIGKIDFGEIESEIPTESLEKLKKIYTMKSERDIHEKFTGVKIKRDEAENEIELF